MSIVNEAVQKSANEKCELPAAERTRFESACIARRFDDGISKRMPIGRLGAFNKRQTHSEYGRLWPKQCNDAEEPQNNLSTNDTCCVCPF